MNDAHVTTAKGTYKQQAWEWTGIQMEAGVNSHLKKISSHLIQIKIHNVNIIPVPILENATEFKFYASFLN